MGIEDDKGNSIIRLGSIHAAVFKISLYAMPLMLTWFVSMVLRHDKAIDNHDLRLAFLERSNSSQRGVSQSVNVGDASAKLATQSHKGYLTTAEVATREGVDPRTILNYIEANRIEPAPEKQGKEWTISANYRILPKSSENVGNVRTVPPDDQEPTKPLASH